MGNREQGTGNLPLTPYGCMVDLGMAYEQYALLEFQDRFQTEEDCLARLEAARWPEGFSCPRCQCKKGYRIETRGDIECAQCDYQASATAGTMFHGSHVPLRKWFWTLFLVSQDKGGVSALRLSKLLKVARKTAYLMLHKIRDAMGERDEKYLLSGYIELDEASFGRAATSKKPDKADNESQVIVMVESNGTKCGSIAMRVVESTSRDSLRDFVGPKVKPGQRFRTDGLQAHYVLRSMGHTLKADPVPPEMAGKELPWVHIVISLAKRFILGTYHGVSSKHLQRYLDEFCYRFNRRVGEHRMFSRLLTACALGSKLTYSALIATKAA